MATALDRSIDQTCSLEHLQVLGGSRERHRKRLCELTHPQFAAGEPGQHVTACLVCQGVEKLVHLDRMIHNHMVDNSCPGCEGQPLGCASCGVKDVAGKDLGPLRVVFSDKRRRDRGGTNGR